MHDAGAQISATQIALFCLLIAGGVVILYSLLFMFTITSVWLIRQTGINHLVVLYREYCALSGRNLQASSRVARCGSVWFSSLPVLMVSNLPANVMVRTFEPFMVVYVMVSGIVLLGVCTVVFRLALRSYRSASS